jgi:hypothetical protein
MKKFYLLLVLVSITTFVKAQDEAVNTEKKQQGIEALKVAFISRELDLTPDEAQKFWPVYNQYAKDLKNTIGRGNDALDRDEKVLNLRKSYKDQFSNVLGQQRMNKMYNAEGRFRDLLIKSMRNQNQHPQNQRPQNQRVDRGAGGGPRPGRDRRN